jgi:hypothetical protein
MAEFDALGQLDAVGATAGASEEQRRVMSTLSEAEVGVLTSIKERLDAVEPDVAAHSSKFGGTFW